VQGAKHLRFVLPLRLEVGEKGERRPLRVLAGRAAPSNVSTGALRGLNLRSLAASDCTPP
jgi:hypothetical protein